MTKKLDLSNVTLCAADCLVPALAARALAESGKGCSFGKSILFSDRKIDGSFRTIKIDRLKSRVDYSNFILKQLDSYLTTPFVLVIQWDGYVVEPRAWHPEFLNYDYIGATWPWHEQSRVGNGGFSLRSKKLQGAVAQMPEVGDLNEDEAICRLWRAELEGRHGMRFAPECVADRFSYEHKQPNAPAFGFHGMFNMWRHCSDKEMINIAPALDANTTLTQPYAEAVFGYFMQRRFGPLAALYRRWRDVMPQPAIFAMLKTFVQNDEMIVQMMNASEAAIQLLG